MERLAILFERHRPAVALFLAAVTLVALFGAARVQVVDVPRDIFRADDEDFAVHQRVLEEFGTDDADCLLVLEAGDWFDAQHVRFLRRVARRAAEVPGVEAVRSLDDVLTPSASLVPRPLLPRGDPEAVSSEAWAEARALARAHPLVRGHVLSEDGGTTLVVVSLPADAQSLKAMTAPVRALQELARELSSEGVARVRLTGLPTIRVEIFDTMETEALRFTLFSALAGFATALVFFRRLGPVLMTMSGAALGATWAFGAMGLYGARLDILTTSVPGLVMVIGFTDALHLMIDVRRSRAAGVAPVAAARDAIRHLGTACLLTSVTTAVGFLSLAVARVDSIRNFGVAVGAGVLVTFVAVLLAVPLVTSLSHAVPRSRPEDVRPGGPLERFVRGLLGHARAVAGVGIGLTALLLAFAPALRPDNRVSEATPRSFEAIQALFHCDRAFGGILPANVLVEWDEPYGVGSEDVRAAIRDVEALVRADEVTSEPLSVLDLLATFGSDSPPAMLALLPADLRRRFVRPELHRALVRLRLPDLGVQRLEPTLAALEAGLAEVDARHPAVRLRLTGTGVVARENINAIIRDLAVGLGLASAVIFLVLTALLGSVRLGALTLLPNVFPLALIAAWIVLTGRALDMSSAIVFTICLGLAVDDTVHVIARYRRELVTAPSVREAVARSVLGVAPAIVLTTAVLTVGFGLLMTSDFPNLKLTGELSSLGFVAALVGDLVFLPALLVCFGGRRDRLEDAA